jgi:hypothetical protein
MEHFWDTISKDVFCGTDFVTAFCHRVFHLSKNGVKSARQKYSRSQHCPEALSD